MFPKRMISAGRDDGITWMNPSIKTTYKAVCKKCNNGWMSGVENATKPILAPMVRGQTVSLSADDRAVLSSWAVKTAMVFEHMSSKTLRYWREEERRAFAASPHRPPAGTEVLAASYVGSRLAFAYPGVHTIGRISGDRPVVPALRTTLVVGHVVLQVLSDRYEEVTGSVGWSTPTPGYDRTMLLWPPARRVVEWSTANALDDAALELFARGQKRT